MKSEFKAKLIQHLLNRKDSEKGFTLIELLVVVIIIGILAAIALPTFLTQVNKARQAEGRNFVTNAVRLQQDTYAERGAYATDLLSSYSYSVGIAGGQTRSVEVGGIVAAGALDTSLKFYNVAVDAQSGPVLGTDISAHQSAISAIPVRSTLKSYLGAAWLARAAGTTSIPEVYTRVCEEVKPGTVTAAVPRANIKTPVAALPTGSVQISCTDIVPTKTWDELGI